MRHKIKHIADIQEFVFAGNARFTVTRAGSDKHVSFRVKRPRDNKRLNKDPIYFVILKNDLGYIGYVKDLEFYPNRKLKEDDKKTVGYSTWLWLFSRIVYAEESFLDGKMEFWHEGRCGRCGRTLTVPESVESGIGPECAKRTNKSKNISSKHIQ